MRALPHIAVAAFVASSALVLVPASARADGGSASSYAYSYEIQNADARADKVLVVWPRACGASGDPLGAVDLALNPDWASRMNDVDYEVVVSGKHHELQDGCTRTTRLYALPADAFPRGSRDATADDSAIGQKAVGAKFVVLPALDAIDRKARIDFFANDPRVLRTVYRFAAVKPTEESRGGVKSVHDVLVVDGFDATSFTVRTKHVVYTYMDGRTEIEAATTAMPTPSAGPIPSATKSPENAGPRDLGTRWVFLAAVGGLVLGGVIAFFRKKRPS